MGGKSVIQPLTVEYAERQHKCRYNKRHIINKGDKRLSIRVGRSDQTYCVECAEKFVTNGITALTFILAELDVKQIEFTR